MGVAASVLRKVSGFCEGTREIVYRDVMDIMKVEVHLGRAAHEVGELVEVIFCHPHTGERNLAAITSSAEAVDVAAGNLHAAESCLTCAKARSPALQRRYLTWL